MAEYTCPHCKKPIYDDEALSCLYCGEALNRGVGFLGKMKYSQLNGIFIIIAAIVLISFILTIVF